MSNKNWKYCEECGIYSLVNEDGICVDCEQEAFDEEAEEDEEDMSFA